VRFAFESLPGSPIDTPQPAVPVSVDGPADRVNLLALVDTGPLFNRFGRWVADEVGIDLDGLPVEHIGVGVYNHCGSSELDVSAFRFRVHRGQIDDKLLTTNGQFLHVRLRGRSAIQGWSRSET
jgi:hypothetical protein